jgi:3-oxoacyl-[acyl-carrier-protein] synthase-3
LGTGSYVPLPVMTNTDLERIVDTTDDWIVTRTGIRERRVAPDDMACSDLAVEASKRALEMAGLTHEDIDLLICGTVTPDYKLPSNACVIQEKMGLPNATAFDVASACTGFINGLSIADSLIAAGKHRRALVVGAEKLSSMINYRDRNTCVLFGDAAGAVVMKASDNGQGVLSTFLKSDGSLRSSLWTKAGGSANPINEDFPFDGSDKIRMNGSVIFKVAVREMVRAATAVLDKAGLTPADIRLCVPHQANVRIIDAMVERLGLREDQVYLNIDRYGNTSAASVPLALDEANRKGMLKPGDYVLMVAFGGGLIWGAALVKW